MPNLSKTYWLLTHLKTNITMKILKYALLVCVLIGGVAVTGCEKKGPMEEAGEAIDDAAKDAGEAAKDAGEKVEDAVGK